MTDPMEKAGATAPPIVGAGCTQRFDPEYLGPDLGTDFPGAAELWKLYRSTAGGKEQNSAIATEADR